MNKPLFIQKLIQEEIELVFDELLTEQDTAGPKPPDDPNAAAPAAGGDENKDQDSGDPVADMVKDLGTKTVTNIRKTLINDLQNGIDREKVEKLIAKTEQEKDKEEIPSDIVKAVKAIKRTFNFKVPEEIEKEMSAEEVKNKTPVAQQPQPVQESKIQTILREYLHYKHLYKKYEKVKSK